MIETSAKLELLAGEGVDVATGPEGVGFKEFWSGDVIQWIDTDEGLGVVPYGIDAHCVSGGAEVSGEVAGWERVGIDEGLKVQWVVICIYEGNESVRYSRFVRVPTSVLICIAPQEALDTDLGRHIGSIGDDTGEDIAGDSQGGFHSADFDGLADLCGKDWDLEIEVN